MNKRDATIQHLKTLAIIMVIDDHCGQKLGIMTSIFPYNSFYMPLFVFISGYLFKDVSFPQNIRRAFKRIMLPYVFVNVWGVLLSLILTHVGLHWNANINISTILNCLFLSPISTINGPAWYAIMYFWVFITYSIVNCGLGKIGRRGRSVASVAFIGVGILSLHLCRNGFLDYTPGNIMFDYRLLLMRTMFYLSFFHFGRVFHESIEEVLSSQPSRWWYVAAVCILINITLSIITGQGNIIFPATAGMRSFKSDWLPYLTSMSGIFFWFSFMKIYTAKIGQIRIVDFIADSTFIIMSFHLLFADMPGFVAYFDTLSGKEVPGFDVANFVNSAWYRWYDNKSLYTAFLCGLLGSLILSFVVKLIKEHTEKKRILSM